MWRSQRKYIRLAFKEYWFEKICNRCWSLENICVHHIDEDTRNNEKENFEILCKSCHTSHHMTWNKNWFIKWNIWKKCINSKKVKQYDLEWNLIKIWDSLSDVYRELWIHHSWISMVCNWKRNSAGWFLWKN